MKNIALVMGGYSGEHDISINSGNQVFEALDKTKYNPFKIIIDRTGWYSLDENGKHIEIDKNDFSLTLPSRRITFDLAFIIIHGNPGENGVLQGYFDMIGLPYTSCDFYTSVLTFNKGYCNPVVRNFGIVNVAKSIIVHKSQPIDIDSILSNLRLPLFVKPASGGSSVATTKVKSREQLIPAIQEAFSEDNEVMIEEFIKGREFDCGVLRAKEQKYIFPITEIIPTNGHEFFDYAAKYEGFSNEVTPAEVDKTISDQIQEISSRLYDLLNCRGIVRFDYIFDTDRNELYFLEVNTIPGQSAESIVPKQARAIGISTAQLYDMVIEASIS